MERYIIFIRNNKTDEEFVVTRRARPGAHPHVLNALKQRYTEPQYTVHTCYSANELQDILDTVSRWTGTAKQSQPKQSFNRSLPPSILALSHR